MTKRIALLCTAFAIAATTVLAVADTGGTAEFTMPSEEVLLQLIENPEMIADIVEGAREHDVAAILISVVGLMEDAGKTEVQIAAVLNSLLQSVAESRGSAFGSAVMVRIRKKVSPRVLPIIPAGSREYHRQRSDE